jgi:type II secretion system protein N
MRKLLFFLALFLVFVVVTFPHRLIVDHFVAGPLAKAGVGLTFGDVSPCWPPGYTIDDVRLRYRGWELALDDVQVDLSFTGSIRFDADGCGGIIRGSYHRAGEDESGRPHAPGFEVTLSDVNPATCVTPDTFTVSGTFGGAVELDGVGQGARGALLGATATSGHATVSGHKGTIAGTLPPAADDPTATGRPIGTWEFAQADLEASLDGLDVVVTKAAARAEGVAWQLDSLRLTPIARGRARLVGRLRARTIDQSARAKAILAILPKAGNGRDGWRHYRLGGTLVAPEIIGLK